MKNIDSLLYFTPEILLVIFAALLLSSLTLVAKK